MLSIENLNESYELDTATTEELTGGIYVYDDSSIRQNILSMNDTSLSIGAVGDSVVALGSINLTTVAAGSAQSWIQFAE